MTFLVGSDKKVRIQIRNAATNHLLLFQEYKFTLVFGKVVEGFDKLLEVSRIKVIFLISFP